MPVKNTLYTVIAVLLAAGFVASFIPKHQETYEEMRCRDARQNRISAERKITPKLPDTLSEDARDAYYRSHTNLVGAAAYESNADVMVWCR